ncbi:MAG TPA: 3-octaprenyl-4-hydroxybenzoate carboxy-lyase [Rhodospirillaceae bacterium]|nr:MAG: 3-octaprenyl-4-hydroxybenzoate carboxy-lyase [Alphaproteobacteria bacterium GWF2_58_20]HAU29948.1 3-octaprenyl-4-hydroxybenzoate carboxy-lyase [Rhodospirillaceae bacterium]
MKRIIVGISGATGAIYGVRALMQLRGMPDVETHLVVTESGLKTLEMEVDMPLSAIAALAHASHDAKDVAAPVASGSFPADGMIVAPCSVRSLSAIAYGQTDTLLARAADCILKQRRPLVLMLREAPLHAGHIRSMQMVTEMGGIVFPASPVFYTKPQGIEAMVDETVARALDLLGIQTKALKRWRAS